MVGSHRLDLGWRPCFESIQIAIPMNEDEKVRSLYPDILEKGGLLPVIRALFANRVPGVTINGFGTGQNFAHVELADKSSQIFLRLDERGFSFDFWRAGQKQASGTTPNLREVRTSVEQWLTGNGDVDALAKAYPFVRERCPRFE